MPTLSKEQGQQIGKQNGQEIVNCRVAAIEKAGGTFVKIARELAGIAFSDVADYVTVAEGGEVQPIPLQTIPTKKRKAIKKIKENTKITEASDGSRIYKDSRVEYELYDKMEALKYLCRLRGDEVIKADIGIQGIEDILRRLDSKP
jgi:hypothetical protein